MDVFFVISGFLISSHLLKEINSSGRLRLGAFYARRIMRLLPAAFLVICMSAVATWRYLPYDQWTENAKEFLASTLYYENWLLAARSINYSAQTQAETVVRHYWSLSVEEQFYLVWPLLLLAVTWAVRNRNENAARRTLIASLVLVAIVFFTVSVLVTAHSPNQAYFVTPTRMWEFSVGGLVALIAPRLRLPRITAELAALIGLAAKREGWDLSIALLKGCPPTDTRFTGYGPNLNDPATVAECNTRTARVIRAQQRPNLILTAAYTRNETVSDGTSRPPTAQMVSGLQKMWLQWTNVGAEVVAAKSMPGIGLVDLTNEFCDATRCVAAIGGASIYFEASHLNGIYAELLEPYFLKQMAKVAPGFVTRR